MKNKKEMPVRILFYLTGLYIFVLIFIRLVASFYPELRLWGFSHAAYIDGMIFIYPLLFIAALLIAYRTYRKPNLFPSLNEKLSKKDIFFSFAVFVGTAAVFIFFSVEEYFLGDGYQLISWLADPLLGLKTRAYGEMYIHQEFSRLLGGTGESPVINSFKILSILSGIIFVVSFLYYGKKLTETKFQYYSIVLLGIVSAIALQFFGYIELYSITIAMLTIFFLSGVTALKYSKKSVVPLITFGLAVFLHKLALIFFPTLLIYLFYLAPTRKLHKSLSKNTSTVFIGMAAIFFVAYIFALTILPIYWQQSFLPPLEGQFTTDNYYLLSGNHLIDFINLLFFMLPIAVFVFIARFFIKNRDSIENPIALFLGSSALFGVLAAFVLEPKLGMARDWDFMAVALLGAHITGVYYWVAQYKSNRYFQPATIILLLIGLSILIPWISLHNSPDALYSYTKDALIRDPKHGRTGMEFFITYHERMGNPAEKRDLQMLFLRHFPEKSMFVQAQSMLENKKYVQAERLFERVIRENPGLYLPYQSLGRLYIETGRYRRAIEYLKLADGTNPYNAETNYYLGTACKRLGDTSKAMQYWEKSLSYDIDFIPANKLLGIYYYNENLYDSASSYLGRIIDQDNSLTTLYYLIKANLQKGDSAKAFEYFNKYKSRHDYYSLNNFIESIEEKRH